MIQMKMMVRNDTLIFSVTARLKLHNVLTLLLG